MANKNITVMLDMLMNTSNVNSGIGQIRQQLKTLKLPSNLQDSFRKSFSDLDDGVSKIQRRLNSGFKTKSDVTGLEKELKNVDNIITNIKKADSYDERFNLIIDAEVKAVNEDYAAIPVAQQSYAILSRMDANNLDFIPFGVPINFKHVTLN